MYKTKIDVFKGKVILLVVALILPLLFALDTSAATLSMTISSSSLALTMVPNSAEGNFASSDDLNVSVSLSGVGGYTLGIKAASSAASARTLINSAANAALATISSAITPANYADNTYASTNSLNNTWGYLPNKYNSAANTSYRPAPTADGDILDVTSEAGNNTAVNYTISIGARADTSTKPGTYSNTFVIFAVANHPDCNPSATTIDTAVCMQDMNDNVINSMEPEVQYQLYDNRDYKKYYIAKMKDGRVWMTQNLDLDLEHTPTNVAELTSLNTDLNIFGSDNYDTSNGYECSNPNTTTNCTASGEVIKWTPANTTVNSISSFVASYTAPYSFDYERYYYPNASGGTTSGNKSNCESTHGESICPHYYIGNYYNFTAAVASNSTNGINTKYKTMGNSVCPAGWRLPQSRTSTTSTDMGYYSEINYTLVSQGIMSGYVKSENSAGGYVSGGWNNLRNAPLFLTVSGKVLNTGVSNTSYAYYLTSTVYSVDYGYFYDFRSYSPYPLKYSGNSKQDGTPVRCVAKQANTGSTVISYDKNASDATGTVSSQTPSANSFETIANNAFTRNGYVFNSWNTRPDGSGTTYNGGDTYYAITGTATTNVTLYAQWDKGYIVTFKTADANTTGIYFDGTKYTNNQTVMAYEGHTYNISGDYTTKHGFSSWTITAGSLANSSYPSTTFTMPSSNVTITLASQEATVNISSLQNSSTPVSSSCKNEAITPILVYDSRDNEAYYVARLCDGNYWMLDNLRLDLTNSTVINNLSTSNTNASAEALGYLKNGGGSTTDQWPTAGLSDTNWSPTSRYSIPIVNVSGNVTAGSNPNSNTWTGSYTKDTVAPVTYGLGSGKIGVYYNYCAASAGTYCWGNGDNETNSPTTDPNTTISPTARDIEGDICPKGWRMPTGGNYNASIGGGDYENLYNKYSGGGTLGGSTSMAQHLAFKTALSLPLSGDMYMNSMFSQGNNGSFWGATWQSTTSMNYLSVSSSGANFNFGYSRTAGIPVRCVLYDPVTITVNFANGVESVTLKKEDGPAQTVTTSGSTITLERNKSYTISANYTTKYAFASWSATSGTPASSTQQNITYIPSGNATITVTGQEATTDITTLVASTDPVSSNCKNEAITPILVYDPRDNEAYWVARLCDGKYWMLDNLRLDLSKALPSYSGTDKITLSTSNTNASEQAISCLLTGSYGGNACTGSFSTGAVATKSWSNSYNLPYIATSGACNNASYCAHNPSTNQWTADSISPITYGSGSGKIGVYYNYCAASAGSYCYASNSGVDIENTWRDIESDICPAGWSLPTGNTNSGTTRITDYGTLYAAYSGAAIGQTAALRNALSTPLSGYFSNGSAYGQGTGGYFWSSTWSSTGTMYHLGVYSSVYPSDYEFRSYGRSVRCVLGS